MYKRQDLAQRTISDPWVFTRIRQGNIEGASTPETITAVRTQEGVILYSMFHHS